MPTPSFMIFYNEKREAVMRENPTLRVGKVSQLIGKAWSKLDKAQKEPYIQKSAADNIRYQKEKTQNKEKGFFLNKQGKIITDAIVKPKKPLSGFMFFFQEQNKKLKVENKGLKGGSEYVKQLGKDWKALAENDKQKYQIIAQKDKARYKEQMNQLQSQGYFINSDGVKSTDLKPKRQNFIFPDKTSKSPLLQLSGSNPPAKLNTAFFSFMNQNRQALMKEFPNLTRQADCMKIMGLAWVQLNKTQKKPYQQLEAADQIRYYREMKQFKEEGFYINQMGENSKNLYKPKLTDDIVQPKQPIPAFCFYNIEQDKKVRAANLRLGGVNQSSSIISKNWKSLSENDKKKYQTLADQDKARYQKEIDQLMTQGYFINKDGVKSTDLKAKKLKRHYKVPVEIQKKDVDEQKESIKSQVK